MKIIKDGSRYLDAKKIYDKANEDCGRCPCCGLVSRTSVKVIDNFLSIRVGPVTSGNTKPKNMFTTLSAKSVL